MPLLRYFIWIKRREIKFKRLDKLIREAKEEEFEELVMIAADDGFAHPNKVSLEWIKKRSLFGDRFYKLAC